MPFIKWRGSTFSKEAILTSISRDGCILLEHQRETVASFFPTCSASHLPVLPCSTKTTLILFIFCGSILYVMLIFYNILMFDANLQIYIGIKALNLIFLEAVIIHSKENSIFKTVVTCDRFEYVYTNNS